MRLNGQLILAAILLGLFASSAALALPLAFPANVAPLVIGCVGMLLAGVQVVREYRSADKREPAAPQVRQPGVNLFAWFTLFVTLTVCFGLVMGCGISIAAFLRWYHKARLVFSGVVALCVSLLLHLLFDVVLELALWQGLVFA